jgi:heterodisulfide reductase subunit C
MKKNFGYSIQPDRQISFDQKDMRIIDYLNSLEPSFRICIGCGSCTATCTAGHFVDFNIRRFHTILLRCETKLLKNEIEKCMFCGKCQLVCPRGINMRNLILAMHSAIEKFRL